MFTIDFQKEYKYDDFTLTVIVVNDSDGFPAVFQERNYGNGTYYKYYHDEYYIASYNGLITQKLSVQQLMDDSLLPDDLYWAHP